MSSEEQKTFGGKTWDAWKEKPQDKNATHLRGNLPRPKTILERYKSVALAGDIMFINSIYFISTISRHVNFMTAEHIANAEASMLQESIRQVKQVYMKCGFNITNILMDGKFNCIRGNLAELKINLNICWNDEHIGEIEQIIRTIK